MTYFDDSMDDFAEIIAEELMETLNDELTNDYANACAKGIIQQIAEDHDERYVLISTETGQLASRMLFETAEEALDRTKQDQFDDCVVAVLLTGDFSPPAKRKGNVEAEASPQPVSASPTPLPNANETSPTRKTCLQCDRPPVPGNCHCRYCILEAEASEAFWDVIARKFPQAKSGDLSPLITIQQTKVNADAIEEWVINNVTPHEDEEEHA